MGLPRSSYEFLVVCLLLLQIVIAGLSQSGCVASSLDVLGSHFELLMVASGRVASLMASLSSDVA